MTLGEKLRQAREAKGFTVSEVAEQTRISPLYLESIENDDYSILPGGIFNKGFVKSYAKFVGINEHEALLDYTNLISQNENAAAADEPKTYRPQVLTDEGHGRSMVPTAIIAIVILATMTGGILFLLNYLRAPSEIASNATPKPSSTNRNVELASNTTPANSNVEPAAPSDAPAMGQIKVEFKVTEDVSISATTDGTKVLKTVTPSSGETFEPKESLKLSYSRSLAKAVQLTINGKAIATPATPIDGKRAVIEFEINKDNLPAIWKVGAISTDVPSVTADANALPNPTTPQAQTQPRSTPAPKPVNAAPTNANTGANAAAKPPAANAKPNPTPRTQPPANKPANRPGE